MKRSRRRSPILTPWDRVIFGFSTLLVSPKRLGRIAVTLKTSTLWRLHRALMKRKYCLLHTPRRRGRRPGPNGPARELIDAVVEMKRRNPSCGCRKIAEQISSAFGIELDNDVLRRILSRYYRPRPCGGGPSWLATVGHARDRLWSVDLFRVESILLKSYWVMVVMDVFTRRIVRFGVAAANLDGIQVCRMFNRAIARQTMPGHLSSDHDPFFCFQRWRANLQLIFFLEDELPFDRLFAHVEGRLHIGLPTRCVTDDYRLPIRLLIRITCSPAQVCGLAEIGIPRVCACRCLNPRLPRRIDRQRWIKTSRATPASIGNLRGGPAQSASSGSTPPSGFVALGAVERWWRRSLASASRWDCASSVEC